MHLASWQEKWDNNNNNDLDVLLAEFRCVTVLQLMTSVELLQPAFFTLEEVPSFLKSSVKSTGGGSVTARCIWAVVLPLLDMGYQVDVRVINAANFGTPHCRPVSHCPAYFGKSSCP